MTARSPNRSETVQQMVRWLNSQVGTKESGPNCIPYWKMSTKPEWNCIGNWCQAFVQVALSQNGHKYIPCTGNLYYLVSAAVHTARQEGRWIPVGERYKRVDVTKPNTMYAVVYGFVNGSQYQHIGWMIDWWDAAGNYVQTIEGNTSSGNSGSQANGEGVYERHRPMSNGYIQVNGFIEYTFEAKDELEMATEQEVRSWIRDEIRGALTEWRAFRTHDTYDSLTGERLTDVAPREGTLEYALWCAIRDSRQAKNIAMHLLGENDADSPNP